MAKKTKKSAEKKVAQTPAPAVETVPAITPKLIVAQRKFNRWYVYFKGVAPKDNVGCGCKTAKSGAVCACVRCGAAPGTRRTPESEARGGGCRRSR